METQKIINLNQSRKFATRKWYIINGINNKNYGGEGDNNPSNIKFETKVLKPNLCDYSNVYILVTGKITTAGDDDNTKVTFKIVHHLLNVLYKLMMDTLKVHEI